MAKKVKLEQGGQTLLPVTTSDMVVHPTLKVTSDKLIGELNISTLFPTGGTDGGNKYTLETAIAKIPSDLRRVGIKCSFINAGGVLESWEWQGGTFTDTGVWLKYDRSKIADLLQELYIDFSNQDTYTASDIAKVTIARNINNDWYVLFFNDSDKVDCGDHYNKGEQPFLEFSRNSIPVKVLVNWDLVPVGKMKTYSISITANNSILEKSPYINYKVNLLPFIDELERLKTKNEAYWDVVKNPLLIQGGKVLYAGDSIVRGNINSSSTTNNSWVKLLSELFNLTYTNKAVGGSTFSLVEGRGQIRTQIESVASNISDYESVIIGGGINDYLLKIDIDAFKEAVEDICTYLKSIQASNVIFITPINTTRSVSGGVSLREYRNVITEVALVNGYGVVDGSKFPFPSEENDYAHSVFGYNGEI